MSSTTPTNPATTPAAASQAAMNDYLFDLTGYLVLKQALSPDEVAKLNATLDGIPPVEPGQWHGHVHRQDHPVSRGVNYQQVVEAGPAFEALIDHPAWIDLVRRYVGNEDGLYIDENFASLRGPGQFINIHSGADRRRIRTQFRYHDGEFRCGQVNILIALTDIGPGDGATMVIPGTHKSNLTHPRLSGDYQALINNPADDVEGAIEVHMQAGDALLFVDCLCHGSAARVNPGQRRIVVYRYGPHWGNNRFGYTPSSALLGRVSPAQARILQPIAPLLPPGGSPGMSTGGAGG